MSDRNRNTAGFWNNQLDSYFRSNDYEKWLETGKQIVKRYTGEGDYESRAIFNILWANVKTQKPALFSQLPSVVAERRHQDPDPVARLSAQVIERTANVQMELNNFKEAVDKAVLDYLLVGRGVIWCQYTHDTIPETVVTPQYNADNTFAGYADADGKAVDPAYVAMEPDGQYIARKRFVNQAVRIDYINYRDFAHSLEAAWEDVKRRGWVGRRVSMTRDEAEARFGDKVKDLASGTSDSSHTDDDIHKDRLEVWEIWDAVTRKRFILARGDDKFLSEEDDPYQLAEFFPCPRPIYSTVGNDSLKPAPDFVQIRGLVNHAELILRKILGLTRQYGVKGVYRSSVGRIGTMLKSQDDLSMLAVTESDLVQGAGLQDIIDFVPLGPIREAVAGLLADLDHTMRRIYEINGITDTMRGVSDHREKATQSNLKASYGAQRMSERRTDVEVMVRDALRIIVEMTVELFDRKAVREMSGFDYMPQLQDIREQDPAMLERGWRAVMGLLNMDELRKYRIDIETGSTVEMMPGIAQEERTQFITSIGNFMGSVLPFVQADPNMAPLVGKMLEYTARGYRAGRSLESAIEEYVDTIGQVQQQQQGQGQQQESPSPEEQAKAQADMQASQFATMRQSIEVQKKQQEMEIGRAIGQAKLQAEQAKADREATKAQIERARLAAGGIGGSIF